MTKTILVTGAGGQLGRRVVELLLEAGTHKVIAGSRDPGKLADLAAKGAETRKVDFDDPGLAAAFAGVDRLMLISTDAIDRPGRRLAQHQAAVAAAEAASVGHVVYTSMLNPEPGSLIPFAPDHYGTEQALAASKLDWTVLRNSWYSDNLLGTLPQVLASGQWFTSAAEGRTAHVSREDCARAAVAALTAPTGGCTRYDITGAEALTTDEIAAVASKVFGKPIAVFHTTDEGLAQGLGSAGLPPPMVSFLVAFDANTRTGAVGQASGDVQALTGAAPQSLQSFLTEHKAAFRAPAPA